MESWGQELAVPAQQGSPNCSTGQQCLQRAPGTRLQHARLCSGQCPSVTAAIESRLTKNIQRYSYEVSGLLTYLKCRFPWWDKLCSVVFILKDVRLLLLTVSICSQTGSGEGQWDRWSGLCKQTLETQNKSVTEVCGQREEKRKTFASLCLANPGNSSACVLTSSKSVPYPMVIYPKL